MFARFFSSVYRQSNYNYAETLDFIFNCDNDDIYQIFTEQEILSVLLNLDIRKGKGPDLIPPVIYKKCAYVLTKPIRLLIEKSVNSGCFPDKLKISYVTPIFKSGNKKDIKNYRSVSVVSTLAKIFEKVVLNRYSDMLNLDLYKSQHGLMKNRSTVSNLLETTSFIASSLEKRSQTDIIYLDFEKAFDSVNHHLLLKKLMRKRLCKGMLLWMLSFVSERKNIVRIKGIFF